MSSKIFRLATILFICPIVLSAQVSERKLSDTIQYLIAEITSLENEAYQQELFVLNFDPCNLEIHLTPRNNPDKWNIYSFWLPNLDENQMQLLPQKNGEWTLILKSMSLELLEDKRKEIQFSKDDDSGFTDTVMIYGADKDSLISIGKAMYFSIQQCKGLDRFK